MMENYQIDINKENKKTDDIYNIATEILKNAHRIAKVQTSSKDITEVIQNYDREKAIILIAQYINKYKNILNFLSKFTGRYIIYEPNFYIDKSDEIILCDLKYIRNVNLVSVKDVSVTYYNVTDEFPSITVTDISECISNVKYDIDFMGMSKYAVQELIERKK